MAQRSTSGARFAIVRADPRRVPSVPEDKDIEEIVMALVKLAALGALGYVAYKFYENQKSDSPAAFSTGQAGD